MVFEPGGAVDSQIFRSYDRPYPRSEAQTLAWESQILPLQALLYRRSSLAASDSRRSIRLSFVPRPPVCESYWEYARKRISMRRLGM